MTMRIVTNDFYHERNKKKYYAINFFLIFFGVR